MTFQVNFPRYQVETASDQFQSPTQQKAEEIYQKYVNQKVPCELFLDGKLQRNTNLYDELKWDQILLPYLFGNMACTLFLCGSSYITGDTLMDFE